METDSDAALIETFKCVPSFNYVTHKRVKYTIDCRLSRFGKARIITIKLIKSILKIKWRIKSCIKSHGCSIG